MGVNAVQIVVDSLSYALDVFSTMLQATGLLPFYLSMLAIVLIVAYLLSNFFVPVGSDSVSSPRSSDSDGVRRQNVNPRRDEPNNKGNVGKF